MYLGDTSLKRLAYTSAGYYRQPSILASINCCVMVVGFWFNVVMAFDVIFGGDKMYTFTDLVQLMVRVNSTQRNTLSFCTLCSL